MGESVVDDPLTAPPGWLASPRATMLLWSVMSPINTGMILRVAESFQLNVAIFDPNGVFADEGKQKTISDFACGALQRLSPNIMTTKRKATAFLKGRRMVATSIEPDATSLPKYHPRSSDVIVLGNEYDGLPEDLTRRSGLSINVPMPAGYTPKPRSHAPIDPSRTQNVSNDGKPNLNVAVAAGLICYRVFMATRRHDVVM